MAHRTRRELDGRFTAGLGRQVFVPPLHALRSNPTLDATGTVRAGVENRFTVQIVDSTDIGGRRATEPEGTVTRIQVFGSHHGVALLRGHTQASRDNT
jgi:hypothetical protein